MFEVLLSRYPRLTSLIGVALCVLFILGIMFGYIKA